jgi:hypothetical protein
MGSENNFLEYKKQLFSDPYFLFALDDETTLADLRARFARSGHVTWIGLHAAEASARSPSSSRNISAQSPRWRGSTPSISLCCGATWSF